MSIFANAENDTMFLDTVKLIDECDISWLHIFPYSERPNTPASRMPQVEKSEIVKRSKTLRELAQQKKIQHFTKLKNICYAYLGNGKS